MDVNVFMEFRVVPGGDSVKRLRGWLRAGGDPNAAIDPHGATFVHYAAVTGDWAAAHDNAYIQLLREAVAHGGDCNGRNAHGETPLHYAAAGGDHTPGPVAVRFLIEECAAGANVQNDRGDTPLHAAFLGLVDAARATMMPVGVPRHGGGLRRDVMRALLEGRADPNIRNGNGDTPLMLAVKEDSVQFSKESQVSLFLQYGADPNTRDNQGATPLIRLFVDEDGGRAAAASAPPDVTVNLVGLLLDAGADPCLADRGGKLPIDHAQDGSDAWRLLRRAGSKCARGASAAAAATEDALGLSRDDRRRVQSGLKEAGFDPGAPDGFFGPRTRAALRSWQAEKGIEGTGYLTREQADALIAASGTGHGEKAERKTRARVGCIDLTGRYYCPASREGQNNMEVTLSQNADNLMVHAIFLKKNSTGKEIGVKEATDTDIIDGRFHPEKGERYSSALSCNSQRLRKVLVSVSSRPDQPRNAMIVDYRLDEKGNLARTVHKGRIQGSDLESVTLGESLSAVTCQRK